MFYILKRKYMNHKLFFIFYSTVQELITPISDLCTCTTGIKVKLFGKYEIMYICMSFTFAILKNIHISFSLLVIIVNIQPTTMVPLSQLKYTTSSRPNVLCYVITGRLLRTVFVARMPEVDAKGQG